MKSRNTVRAARAIATSRGGIALLALACLLSFSPPAAAAVEYDCGADIVCEPDPAVLTCSYSAEWGSLSASVHYTPHTNRSPTGTASATATPIGNELMERWIITSCTEVTFRPYAPFTGTMTGMNFCLTGQGEPGRPNCASWTYSWLQNRALSNTAHGDGDGAWCGGSTCYDNSGTVGHAVSGITISQPGGRNVPVVGHTQAFYQEDGPDADEQWTGEDPYSEDYERPTVSWRIGSTP